MTTHSIVVFALVLIAFLSGTRPAMAQELTITDFTHNGDLVWQYPKDGVIEYRIEWSPSPEESWSQTWGSFTRLSPTGDVMSVPVPRFYRVVAHLADTNAPPGMASIPAGTFEMGDTFAEGDADELPLHSVYVSEFFVDVYEVTETLWGDVSQWAMTNGYDFPTTVTSKGPTHPVRGMHWGHAVKWCNARSEKEGLSPAYYLNDAKTIVYRTGQTTIGNNWVDWSNGYRLPTEAEWEKAAR